MSVSSVSLNFFLLFLFYFIFKQHYLIQPSHTTMSKTSPPDLSLCTWPGWSYLILAIPPLLVIIAVHIYLLVDVVCEYSTLELDEIRLSPQSVILYVFMIAPCVLSIVQGYRTS